MIDCAAQTVNEADKPKSSNRVGFRNKRADEIIETARETFDPRERQRLFREFHGIVHEEQPYTFLFCRKVLPAYWPEVHPEFYPIRPQSFSHLWNYDGSE